MFEKITKTIIFLIIVVPVAVVMFVSAGLQSRYERR